jgi:hypothetical protein
VNHVITEFNKTKEYNKNLKEKVEEIKRICNNLDIPCFLTFCVKNNEMETVYQTEYLSPGQKQQYLKNNRFADYVNIINGQQLHTKKKISSTLFQQWNYDIQS